MSFGKGKRHIQNKNYLNIPIDIDGTGFEPHPTMTPMENKVMSIIKGDVEKQQINIKTSIFKLYLNKLINILFNKNKKTKITKQSKIQKIQSKLFKWWIKDTTNDIKDIIMFVLIHGFLGAPVILLLLIISGIDISLITFLRESKIFLTFLCIIGTGSIYYLFVDINKVLEETWRKKK